MHFVCLYVYVSGKIYTKHEKLPHFMETQENQPKTTSTATTTTRAAHPKDFFPVNTTHTLTLCTLVQCLPLRSMPGKCFLFLFVICCCYHSSNNTLLGNRTPPHRNSAHQTLQNLRTHRKAGHNINL